MFVFLDLLWVAEDWVDCFLLVEAIYLKRLLSEWTEVSLRFHYTPDHYSAHIVAKGSRYFRSRHLEPDNSGLCYTKFTVTGFGASLFEVVSHLSYQTPAPGWRNE